MNPFTPELRTLPIYLAVGGDITKQLACLFIGRLNQFTYSAKGFYYWSKIVLHC